MKSFAVLGLGRFGSSVAKTIAAGDFELLAVDRDADAVQAVVKEIPNAVIADFTNEQALKDLGIGNYDVVVVAVAGDLETAILTTVLLKEQGVKTVVVKAVGERNANILYKIGADQVVRPEYEMGVRVANVLTESDILDSIKLSADYSIVEFAVPEKWHKKTIAQLDLRKRYAVTVLAIKRNHELLVSPAAEEVFFEHDLAVIIGSNESISRMSE